MFDDRASLGTESLFRLALLLVVALIALEVVEELLGVLGWLLGPFKPLLGLAIVVLALLWLVDRL
ncbi:DUF7554 family protein [Haloarchaeobius sp. HRN-SO-5]|uniref:DUF7554 family protein n=1 Tax=Haloarchaeobius sp. HRN-SO-5 TaxID=3446118 RepID=UPI003EBB6033